VGEKTYLNIVFEVQNRIQFFIIDLKLTTVGNHHLLGRLPRLGSNLLNLFDDIDSVLDGTEDNVLAVEPRGLGGAQEKLRSVGSGSGVGHGQDSWTGVLQLEVLVSKLLAVDRLASSSVVVGKVSTLAHEARNDPVK